MPDRDRPLVLVSNRGPVTFQEDGSVKRGTGGLVTALTGLASHRDAIWIASAMTDARRRGLTASTTTARSRSRRRTAASSACASSPPTPRPTTRFYNVIANPMLWFIQHYLWDQSNAPDIRRQEVEAFEHGYNAVNEDLARAVLEEIEDDEEPVVMVHDYHFYTLPGMIRRERPDVFLHHFIHIPWTQPDAWRVLPKGIRDQIFNGLLANDIVGFHTRSYRRNFLQCCRDLMDLDVDMEAGVVHLEDRDVWVRAYPLPIDYEATRSIAARDRVDRVRGEAAQAPARVLDPARRPRGPLQERAARLHRLRHLPRAAPGVLRAHHLHRAADAVTDRRARVRRVPRAHRGAGGGRQPPPRHAGLDADRPEVARRPRGGGRPTTSTTT